MGKETEGKKLTRSHYILLWEIDVVLRFTVVDDLAPPLLALLGKVGLLSSRSTSAGLDEKSGD
jgi:hypothetical protein